MEAGFSTLVQTGPEPTLFPVLLGAGSLSLSQTGSGRGVNHPPASSTEDKERLEKYIYTSTTSLLGICFLLWCDIYLFRSSGYNSKDFLE